MSRRAYAPIVGARTTRIIDRVIDRIDDPTLRRIRRRRHRHVGIAAGFTENGDLIVHTAKARVQPAVVKRPITVDEGVHRATGTVAPQQPVPAGEGLAEPLEPTPKASGRVVRVVQVNLYFAKSRATEGRQAIEVLRTVNLERREKRVLRRHPVGVRQPGYAPGILRQPSADSAAFGREVRSPNVRLEVIGDAQHDVDYAS
jgi:hypothetical protein